MNPASGGDQNAFCPEVLYRKVGNPTYLSAVQTKAIWAFTIPSLAASTTYQIFVRDYRIQAGQNCSTSTAASICDYSTTAGATNSTSVPLWTIRTQDPVCLVTLPSGYSASGQTTSSANLAWTNGTGGTSQNIYVDSNVAKVVAGAGSLIAVGGLSATTNTYTASGLAAGTTYYWRVVTNASQACNIGCTGGGDCPSFNTVAACAATAASSLTSSGVTSSSATLNWLPGFGGWEEYLYVDSDSSKVANGCPSNDCVVNANILEGTATYALSGLSPSKTYYWKVLEYSSGTCSNSASSSLLTQAVAVTTVPTAFVGQSNVVVGIPLGTRFNSTNISITTYINGTLVCPNAPSTAPYLSVVYSLAGTTKPATLLQCSNGVSVYSVNTTNFGLYQLSVYFNAGATIGNFTRQANLERFSDEGHAYASPDFWVGLVPVVALAALYLRKGKSG